MAKVCHKVFISYHHDDQKEVDKFVEKFSDEEHCFICRALGMTDDIIDSDDPDYVMRRIRELYLKDSTVTIVLIGKCTWARRYVDWEIQASLRHGDKTTPNGLLGIRLRSYDQNGYPDRLNKNLKSKDDKRDDCYARCYSYPDDKEALSRWIEDAYQARTERASLIVNPRERRERNSHCE